MTTTLKNNLEIDNEMTIREAQELIRFIDEKEGRATVPNTAVDDLCRRFCEIVREANAAGADLTELLVNTLDDKNK